MLAATLVPTTITDGICQSSSQSEPSPLQELVLRTTLRTAVIKVREGWGGGRGGWEYSLALWRREVHWLLQQPIGVIVKPETRGEKLVSSMFSIKCGKKEK